MTDEGVIEIAGYPDFAGIVYDHERKKTYSIERNTPKLYVLDWNAQAKTLVLEGGAPKILKDGNGVEIEGGGLALDEAEDVLYVTVLSESTGTPGHYAVSNIVYRYDPNNWTYKDSIEIYDLGTTLNAVGVAIYNDGLGTNYLYTGAWSLSGSHDYLVRIDLNLYEDNSDDPNSFRIAKDVGASVAGIAVDPETGLVYVTTSNNRVEVYDTSNWTSDPNQTIDPNDYETYQVNGPAGICVPAADIGYKYPLSLTKTSNIDPNYCISPEADDPNITYTINFAPNAYDNYDTVIIDYLPRQVDYVAGSADPDYGVYNLLTHTVTWDIGDLPAYDPQGPDPNIYFHITVRVNSLAEPLSEIINRVEIESDVSYDVAAIN